MSYVCFHSFNMNVVRNKHSHVTKTHSNIADTATYKESFKHIQKYIRLI